MQNPTMKYVGKKNQIIFAEKTQTYTKLFDNVVYQTISWCKLSNIFTSYSYTTLIGNITILHPFSDRMELQLKKNQTTLTTYKINCQNEIP